MSDTNSPTAPRRVLAAERKRQAVALRVAGATYDQIGRQLGITKQSVRDLVVKALDETLAKTAESAEQLRELECQRLDAMRAALWPDAMKGDEQKIDRLIRISARFAALMGLDAPARSELKVSDADIDAEVARTLGELAGDRQAQISGAVDCGSDPDNA